MKNHRLPDKDEWDKIVDEAFSSDEVHTFSREYNLKKYQNFQVRKGITMKKNNLLMNLTVVATALAVIAVPTGLYVANNMTTTKSNTQFTENEQASPLSDDTIYDVEFGWLPEDFNYNSEDSYTYFTNTGNEKIFMIASFTKNLSGEKTENGKGLTVRDEYQTDDKTVDIRYNDDYVENSEDKNCMNYGRVATIYFKDTPYELELLVTDDVTKDDFKKIIENVKLVESDTETAEIYKGEQAGEDIQKISHEAEKIYNVEYGWLPEGLEYQDEDSPYGGKFHNWNTDDGMTAEFTKVPEGVTYHEDTGNPEIKTTVDKWTLDGKDVVMYYRSTYKPDNPEHNFGRIAFIYFNNTPYVLKLYVTDGISEEDFRKIIENVKLVESDTETAGIYTGEQAEEYETFYDIEYGWIPDSLERIDGETYTHDFKNVNNDRKTISVNFNKNLTGEEAETDSAAPVRDTYETADKTIKVGYYDNYIENSTDIQHNVYGRQALVCFKDSPYELVIWVTDDVTKDDFRKFLENIKLVPTDTEKAWVTYPENVTQSEFTISDGKNDGQVNEGTKEIKETDSKKAENYDDTIYDVEYGWLPEGMEYGVGGYAYKFHNFTTDSGMTPSLRKYPDGNKITAVVPGCTDIESYTADGKTVTISYRSDYQENSANRNYGRIADISFDNTLYSLSLWVTDDITKDDLKMIIANVKLVPSDTETAYIYNPEDEELDYRDVLSGEVYSDVKIYHIGEDIDVDNYSEYYSGYKCRLKVTDISFDNAFGTLNPEGGLSKSDDLYGDFKAADIVDEDGILVDNVRKYVQFAKGDDVKYQEKTETVPTHIMTVKMTYTNTGDTTIENIFDTNNKFMLLTKRDNTLINTHTAKLLDKFGSDDYTKYNFYDTFDVLRDSAYSFMYYVQEKNTLRPNESTEITMAFAVEDEFMDNVYLDLAFTALPVSPKNEASHVVNVSISQKPE